MHIRIVLDIDYTLANRVPEDKLGKYLQDGILTPDDIIYAMNEPHYVYHGVLEFIRYLYDITPLPLTFYSAGAPERTSEFASKLMPKALGEERASARPYKKCDELIDASRDVKEDRKLQANISVDGSGNRKKDLTKTISDDIESALAWTVLIDDDASYVLRGQEANLLKLYGHDAKIPCISPMDSPFDPDHFYSLNRIFYVVGILHTALQDAQQKNISITESLAELQFERSKPMWKPKYYDFIKQEKYYHIGLKVLQRYNSNIDFLATHHYPEDWTPVVNKDSLEGKLILAAQRGDSNEVKTLLAQGANINACDQTKNTPLILSLRQNHIEVAVLLIESGAEVDNVNDEGYTALHQVAKYNQIEILPLILRRTNRSSLNQRTYHYQDSPLSISINKKHTQVAIELIKFEADVDLADRELNTSLMLAAKKGLTELFPIILEHSQKLFMTSGQILLWAIDNNKTEFALFLIKNGVNINAVDLRANTALHRAAMHSNQVVYKTLIHAGANKTLRNKRGETPLDFDPDIENLDQVFNPFEMKK